MNNDSISILAKKTSAFIPLIFLANINKSLVTYSLISSGSDIGNKYLATWWPIVPTDGIIGWHLGFPLTNGLYTFASLYKWPGVAPLG